MTPERITISIVDDHPLVIGGIAKLLARYKHMCLLGAYTNTYELFQGMKQLRPEILLLDLQMPGVNGEMAMEYLAKDHPDVKVIALTAHDTPYYIQTMLAKGCKGYLLKNSPEEEIVAAIEAVHIGKQYLAESIREDLLFDLAKRNNRGVAVKEGLTTRENDILKLIVGEYTSQEIADKLFLSLRTVEKYRLNLLQKLKVKNTAGLVRIALQWNLLNE